MRYHLFVLFFLFGISISAAADISDDIGQLLCVGFKGRSSSELSVRQLKRDIDAGLVGCVVFYNHNIRTPQQTKALIHYLKSGAPFPLIVAVDQEGGKVQRLKKSKGFLSTPSPADVAKNYSAYGAYKLYRKMARQLKDLGFNVNFGVIADLDYSASPIISKLGRSYSSNPKIVERFAEAMIDAHRKEGVVACVKHYPGHGSAMADPHTRHKPIDITDTWRKGYDLSPFLHLIRRNAVDMLMSGHLMHLKMDPLYPVSLSKRHIDFTLRRQSGYGGLVISDDLQMRAVMHGFSFEERVVLGLHSGTDILLFGNVIAYEKNLPGRFRRVALKALESGRLSKPHLKAAVYRVKRFRKKISD